MKIRLQFKFINIVPIVMALLVSTVLWGVIRYYSVAVPAVPLGDWAAHLKLAEEMHSSHTIVSPHFLFQLLVIFVVELLGSGYSFAGFIVDLISNIFLTLLLYYFYLSSISTPAPTFLKRSLVAVAAVLTTILAPLVFNAGVPAGDLLSTYRSHYQGSFHFANVYHNPTVLLLRPFALGLFWLICCSATRSENIPRLPFWRYLLLAIFLVVSNAIAKPSFLIIILPIAGCFWLWALYLRNWCDVKILFFGVLIPSVLVLLIQFGFSYYFQTGRLQVSLGLFPFLMMEHVFGSFSTGVLALFYATLFPLFVVLFFTRRSFRSVYFLTALASTVVAFIWATLFAEMNENELHVAGNFFWCIQIALFILFACSIRILIQELSVRSFANASVLGLLPLLALCMHIYMGATWYADTLKYVLTLP